MQQIIEFGAHITEIGILNGLLIDVLHGIGQHILIVLHAIKDGKKTTADRIELSRILVQTLYDRLQIVQSNGFHFETGIIAASCSGRGGGGILMMMLIVVVLVMLIVMMLWRIMWIMALVLMSVLIVVN